MIALFEATIPDVIASDEAAAGAAGCGRIRVERGPFGRSVVTEAYATSPLRLLTPRNHGSASWIYASSYGGGLVDGDRILVDVEVRRGASAFVATQSSTKVYRSSAGTSSALHGRVEPDGVLVVAPDPVVCFAGANYRQRQTFELAAEAGLVVVDCVTSGRHISGERWAFHSYAAALRVCVDGRLVVHDALALRPEDDMRGQLGRVNVLALVLVLGPPFRRYAAALVARAAALPVERRAAILTSATAVGDGCLVRIAAESVEQAARLVRDQLSFLPGVLGDDPWARKW